MLEVLAAFFIAALALGLLFQGASVGLLSAHVARQYEEAVSRARSHLAALGRSTALAEGDQEGDDGGGFRWHLHVQPIASTPSLGGAVQGGKSEANLVVLYGVEIGISWVAEGRTRELVLRSERLSASHAVR